MSQTGSDIAVGARSGAPTSKGPVIWDQATVQVSHGDILVASRNGTMPPLGAGFDKEDAPTGNPLEILARGTLASFGGVKGTSITFMVEPLAGMLTGSCTAKFPRPQPMICLIDPVTS